MFSEASDPDSIRLYNQLSSRYDRLHDRWLRLAGGEAQAALEASVRTSITTASSLLDVGCGTGNFARALISEGVSSDAITLLDPSKAMLRKCMDIPVKRVLGRLEELPFESGAFSIVTCSWALETCTETERALHQLCRVVQPGGLLCVAFCADAPTRGLTDWAMKQSVLRRGSGRFLHRQRVRQMIADEPDFEVRFLPCRGPAAALIARRAS